MIPASYTILLLCGPATAVAAVWAAERIGVPYPILLVGVGVFLSWFPWTPSPEIPPEIVFYLFLPPLVYYAALFVAPDDLRVNARLVSLLAVGLVVATSVAVAGVLTWFLGVSAVVALVAGAVVAPTDTVSATSVFQRLEAPEELTTVIEGEGLTNDGCALVLYAGAVSTAVAQAVHPARLAVTFLAGPAGGAALGLAIAWALVRLRRRMNHPALEITVSLATPYFAYAAAEAAGLSGVLATAVAGMYVGSRLSEIYGPGARLQAFAFLDVLVFLLNAVLFILVGIQLHRQVPWAPSRPLLHLVAVLAILIAVVIAMRLLFTLLGPALARLRGRRIGADTWRKRTVIGWAGMRGGVSLAAALAIPIHRADGSPFPDRGLVILITGAVVLATLVMQGVTLPWLVRRLGLKPRDAQSDVNRIRLQAAQAALAWLDAQGGASETDDARRSVRELYAARTRRLSAMSDDTEEIADADEMEQYLKLRRRLLQVERSEVLGLRREGRVDAALLRTVERDLDLEEARISGL